jgi:hypothetical protein
VFAPILLGGDGVEVKVTLFTMPRSSWAGIVVYGRIELIGRRYGKEFDLIGRVDDIE